MSHSHDADTSKAISQEFHSDAGNHVHHDHSTNTHHLTDSQHGPHHHHPNHPHHDEASSTQSLLNTSDDLPPAYGTLLNINDEQARLKSRQRIDQRPNGPSMEDFGTGFVASLFCFVMLGFILWLALQ